jgi:CBS domain-containing membrane protein
VEEEAAMNDVTDELRFEGLDELLGKVEDEMTTGIVTLDPDTRTSDAVAVLRRRGIGGAPVVEGRRVIGVATVSDLSALMPKAQSTGPFLRPQRGRPDWCVRDVMTETAVVAVPDEPLARAIVRMDDARVDRLPVVDAGGRPVGMLAREDVLRAVAKAVRRQQPEGHRPLLLPD